MFLSIDMSAGPILPRLNTRSLSGGDRAVRLGLRLDMASRGLLPLHPRGFSPVRLPLWTPCRIRLCCRRCRLFMPGVFVCAIAEMVTPSRNATCNRMLTSLFIVPPERGGFVGNCCPLNHADSRNGEARKPTPEPHRPGFLIATDCDPGGRASGDRCRGLPYPTRVRAAPARAVSIASRRAYVRKPLPLPVQPEPKRLATREFAAADSLSYAQCSRCWRPFIPANETALSPRSRLPHHPLTSLFMLPPSSSQGKSIVPGF